MNAKDACATGTHLNDAFRTGVKNALDALRSGQPVIVVNDKLRDNAGDLVLAAEHATTQSIAFMIRHTSGYLGVAAPEERWEQLQVPRMLGCGDALDTAYGVAVDAREGITTGISARDRARTIRALADPQTRPRDLVRPGHVVTVRARTDGVFERCGPTEAAVDLMRLAGLHPVSVLCKVVRDDGPTAGPSELRTLAIAHDLVIVTIAELFRYRARHSELTDEQRRATTSNDEQRRATTSNDEQRRILDYAKRRGDGAATTLAVNSPAIAMANYIINTLVALSRPKPANAADRDGRRHS